MSEVNAKDVMKLRNKTGLPMMDCKKALEEAGGNFDGAEDLLRKKLKGKMDTKLDRAAGEGRIQTAIAPGRTAGAIVELRAETDFTAKNDKFIQAAHRLAELALKLNGSGAIAPSDEMKAVADDIRIATGENISIGRCEKHAAAAPGEIFGSYVHHDGKTAVLIKATGEADDDTLRRIGMHITAAVPRPLGVSTKDIPADVVERERKFRIDQAIESGKPQQIAEKMVEGGMQKFYAEVALLEQDYVIDPSKKVKDLLPKGSVSTFRRWQVGETA